MLSEISQRKTNTVWNHLHVESKRYNKLVNITKKKWWMVKVAQSCPTLCDPMDCSLLGSSSVGFSRQEIHIYREQTSGYLWGEGSGKGQYGGRGLRSTNYYTVYIISQKKKKSVFSSVTQSCPTLCDPMDCSTSGFLVHHQHPELTQTHVHQVSDAIQPSHPLSSPCPPVFNLSQHQGLFRWVSSSHQVAKVLEFQLQSFQWIFRTEFL